MKNIQSKLSGPVTILMPAYNAEATIDESIQSVINQTFKDWKLLIIDDESTDSTQEICERWAKKDDRVISHRVEHKGFTGVLNYGLSLSRSQYIARIDSDDLWHTDRLEKQLSFLKQNPEVKVIGSWGDQIGTYGERIQFLKHGPTRLSEYRRARENGDPMVLIHSSILADREIIVSCGGYVADNYPVDDTYLWTKIAENHVVLALPENLVSYRASQNGICASNFKLLAMQFHRLEYNLKNKTKLSRTEYEELLTSDSKEKMHFLANYWRTYARRTGVMRYRNRRKLTGGLYIALGFCLDPFYYLKKISMRSLVSVSFSSFLSVVSSLI